MIVDVCCLTASVQCGLCEFDWKVILFLFKNKKTLIEISIQTMGEKQSLPLPPTSTENNKFKKHHSWSCATLKPKLGWKAMSMDPRLPKNLAPHGS